jgi:hypothetical protein
MMVLKIIDVSRRNKMKNLPRLLKKSTIFVAFVLLAGAVLLWHGANASLAQSDAPALSAESVEPVAMDDVSSAGLTESATGLYVIQLVDRPLATYDGSIAGLAATTPAAAGVSRLDVNTPESIAYLDYLQTQHDNFISSAEIALGRSLDVRFQYLNVLNALAVQVDLAEAQRLAELPGVKAVYADELRELTTDVGPGVIGAPVFWDGEFGFDEHRGEGVIVGMLDTGVNYEHPSFAEVSPGDSYVHDNPYGSGNFVGVCEDPTDPDYEDICNDKLIGAWNFHPSSPSATDWNGHGSHVGSTIAGNLHDAVFTVGSDVFTRTVSGVAPRANVISYLVCFPSCPGTSSVAAVDQAIDDGVHVLNYSISGSDSPWTDPVDLAFLDATAAGMFVSASAGNAGPGPSTVAKTGPWNAAVAASTHNRVIANTVDATAPTPVPPGLEGMAAVPGTGPDIVADIEDDIIWAEDADPGNVRGCNPFPANAFDGAIALIQRGDCTFETKVTNANNAGAIAVIVYNHVGGPPIVMGGLEPTTIPAVFIDNVNGDDLADFVSNSADPTARINESTAVIVNDNWQDVVAGFSSRGPSQFDILKPDYIAPGVNILAAGNLGPGDYFFTQGTSMSSPHGAGAAALLVQRFPDWTVAEVKSALSLTAYQGLLNDDGVSPAGYFDIGSGRLALGMATNTGLVMDETIANYEAADPAIGGEPKTLNQPSMVDQFCNGECTWTRTVRSVADDPVMYTAVTDAPAGMALTVEPASFTLDPGATQVLTITADVTGLPLGDWAFAQVNLEGMGATYGDFVELGESYDHSGTWDQKTHDISAYEGQEACLAFRYEAVDGHTWFIDDILLTSDAGTHLDESFADETFPPAGWSIYEMGSDPHRQWARTTAQSNTPPASAWHDWTFSSNHDDNWLVTPQFTLGDNADFTYYDRMGFITWYNYSGVWISTGSCEPQPAAEVSSVHLPVAVIPVEAAPTLTYDPDELESSQETDQVVEKTLTIGNIGTLPLVWEISEGELAALNISNATSTVLWEQVVNGTSGIITDYYNVLGSGVYSADDFELPGPTSISLIHADGFWNTGSLAEATAISWYIYPDDDGVPAGHPEDGLDLHVWTHSDAPTGTGIDITDDNITLDVVAATGSEIDLAAGVYWLTVFPDINSPTLDGNTRWNWYQAAQQLSQAHLVDPGNLFGAGLTEWTAFGDIGLTFFGTAFRLEGTLNIDCEADLPWLSVSPTSGTVDPNESEDVTVTFDSTGLGTGQYDGVLCLGSNDPENELVYIPVTLEVVETPDPAWLQVAHLAPFAMDPGTAVTVTLNSAPALTDFAYGDSTGYIELPAGDYDVEVWPAGSSSPAITGTISLMPGSYYSAIAIGDGVNQDLGLVLLEDDLSAPAAGNFKIRLGHLAPFAPGGATADVYANGAPVLTDVEFGDITGFLELPAGTYDIAITAPGGDPILINPEPVTFSEGDIISAFATGDGSNQDLGVFAWPPDMEGFFLPLVVDEDEEFILYLPFVIRN